MSFPLDSTRFLAVLSVALVASGAQAATAAASPRIVSAAAVDADSDGAIDAFNVRFSAPVRGRAQSRGPFPFRVSGYRVTGAARPSGRGVRVRVAEGSGCDLGAGPKVSYRPRGRAGSLTDARKRPLRRSQVDMARKERRRPPRITCAVTSDGDGDGHLDAVVLTYSKPVRGRAHTGGRFPFEVDRFALNSIERPRGRNLTLRLRERSTFDTDALPAVIYRRPRKGAARRHAIAGAGGRAANATFNATRDKAEARLLSTHTVDADENGLVDAVEGRFSEPVRAGDGAVSVAGGRVTGVRGAGREGLTASLAEGPFGTASRPDVTWGAGSEVRDSAGNASVRATATADDRAAPVLTSARTEDRGGLAGRLDTIVTTFSEPVSHPVDSDGSYPFGVTGYTLAGAGAADGERVELALREGSEADSGARPQVGYTRGAGAPVLDAAGNEAASRTFAGVLDGVVPRLAGARTRDADHDGRLDGVAFEFSEPVNHAAQSCPGCSFTLTGGGLTAQGASAAAGATVTVSVAEGAYNSGLRPTASYPPLGGGVTDSSGNVVAASTVAAEDGAPPVAVSAETADVDSNGRIDRLLATFSEPIAHPGDASVPFSLAAAGYSVASVEAAAGSSLAVHLQERSAPDTGSAPALSYDGSQGTALTDANGTEHASRAYPGLTRDAVPPRFLRAKTADLDAVAGNQPGRIDAIELLFSEELQGSNAPGAFAVPGRTVESVSYGADRVSLRLTEAGAVDTAATTSFEYTPPGTPGDPARLRDLPEGPGDDADYAGPLSGPVGDGAGPVVVAAESADDDADGIIDGVEVALSEDVQVSAGSQPSLALTSPALTVSAVARPTSSTLRANVVEPGGAADGDLKPDVALAAGRITDLSDNPARTAPFTATADGVRPLLIGARSGEEAGGAGCGSAPQNGRVDCVRAEWSEPVEPPMGTGAFSLEPFTLSGSLLPATDASQTDLGLAEGAAPDRTVQGTLGYSSGGSGRVLDLAGNPALDVSGVTVARACADTATSEDNDTRSSTNFPLGATVPQQMLCSGDDDWYRVSASETGRIETLLAPAPGLMLTGRLVDSSDATVGGPDGSSAPGASVQVSASGLVPGETYWLHVTGPPTQEGAYCIDTSPTPGEGCEGGDPLPT